MAVWHCEDCHKIGFYFDISPAEMREKHKQECGAELTELKKRTFTETAAHFQAVTTPVKPPTPHEPEND